MGEIKRSIEIDITKFIALILMVFGHVPPTQDHFHEIIYSFHMPLFFFISGLCYNPERFGWKKGVRTLLVPYLFFNVIVIFLNVLMGIATGSGPQLLQYSFNSVLGILCGSSAVQAPYGLPIGPSWFLLAFFTVKFSAKYILRFNKWVQAFCVLVPFAMVLMLRGKIGWYPWSINCAALCSVFFYFAYHFKAQIIAFLDSSKLIWFIPLLAAITCLSYFNGCADIWNGSYGKDPLLFVVLGVAGTMLMLAVCRDVRFIPEAILFTYRVGALFILCMNMWLMEYIMLVYRRISGLSASFDSVDRVIITIVVFLVSWPCIKLLYRYAPWAMGQIKTSRL